MKYSDLPHFDGTMESSSTMMHEIQHIEHFEKVAEIFKQLGDTNRVRIFLFLCHYEECVINISSILDMTSPAVSHHLRALKSSGLITSRRGGKEVYYRASDNEQSKLLHMMIEQVMEFACPLKETHSHSHAHTHDHSGESAETESEQLKLIKEIHSYLIQNMDKRITIDKLAKTYHVNPTTLMSAFKDAYGTSLAAHIKEHRMSHAARLLSESDLSIAEIACKVGYDSQSKFTAAFKDSYKVLPKEYRKAHS